MSQRNLWDIPKADDIIETIFPKKYAYRKCCAFCGRPDSINNGKVVYGCSSHYSLESETTVKIVKPCPQVHTGKPSEYGGHKGISVYTPGPRKICSCTLCAFCGEDFSSSNSCSTCGRYIWKDNTQVLLLEMCGNFLNGKLSSNFDFAKSVVLQQEKSSNIIIPKCTCKSDALWMYGCQCGAIKAERKATTTGALK